MDPLYTTQTAYTFDEYKRFNKKLTLNKLLLIILIILLLTVVLTLLSKNSVYLIMMLLYIIVICILFPMMINRNLKKVFYADKHLQKNGLRTYYFYESYFEERTNNSYTKFDYDCIHSIVESKTNFYIMKAPNQAYIIVKNNCSPERIAFIANLKNKK